MKTLKISLVKTGSLNKADFDAQEILQESFQSLRQCLPSFPYSSIDFINFSFNDEPNLISKHAITAINPAKYLICKEILGDHIIPILAVRKSSQATPYYPAFFIANKFSIIDSIRSDKIKRVFAVDEESTSGYIAPVYKLWEAGIIQSPNQKGIIEKGWELTFVGNHAEVERRVIEDDLCIGMTGQFSSQDNPDSSLVKPILRYYYLPQDVLVISQDLRPFREMIENLFINLFALDESGAFMNKKVECFGNSSSRICGFSRISNEFNNALEELKRMMQYIDNYSSAKFFQPLYPTNIKEIEVVNQVNELKELISSNKEQEVLERLTKIFNNSKARDELNLITMVEANYNHVIKRQQMGIVADEEFEITINRIRKSLLDIIDEYINHSG